MEKFWHSKYKGKGSKWKVQGKSSRPYDFNIKLYATLLFKEDTNNEMRPLMYQDKVNSVLKVL